MVHQIDDRTENPATVLGSFRANVRVVATCKGCHRDVQLDLRALNESGYGRVALLDLPLKCTRCGKRGHGIIISGDHLAQPLGISKDIL